MFNILVVEDDRELNELFCTVLADNGYHPLPARDGRQALKLLDENYIDLMISDIMMPGMDGYQLTRELREANYSLPILMITAKNRMADKKTGFEAGTDDYMIKPVDINEMLWRVAALLRRSQQIHERRLTVGSTLLDYDSLSVKTPEGDAILPQKEFFVLYKLLSSAGKIFTRRQIIDEVWGVDFESDPHTLEVHISRLRERFRGNPDFEMVTVRGLGYKAVRRT